MAETRREKLEKKYRRNVRRKGKGECITRQ